MRYAFGDFVFDDGTRELRRGDRVVPLGPKAFDLLELLLRSRPRAVSRTRLRAALWPDTHVGASSLHVLVSQVRSALDDDPGEPRWIRTLDRFGYAFAGPATSEGPAKSRSAPGRVRIVGRDQEIVLGDGEHVLGREESAPIRADASGVSRQHARLVIAGDRATLEDLGSKNGTFVGDERVSSPRVLQDGDVFRLGRAVRFTFYRAAEDDTKTEGPE